MSNDVLLVPINVEQPNVEAQSDIVVYIPRAHKNKPGIVKEGDGINIENGVVSLDRTWIQDTIDELTTTLTDNISEIDNKIVTHINDFDNPHRVTKDQLELGNVDNTSDNDKPISRAQQQEFDRINGLIKGASKAVVYTNYTMLIDDLNASDNKKYDVGQTIYVTTTHVPDLWVSGILSEPREYVYVDDVTIVNELETNGFLFAGYYRLSPLETAKTNLTNVVTLGDAQRITGVKTFVDRVIVEPHYANNESFFVLDSYGENMLELNESRRVLRFYGEAIPTANSINNSFVSYATQNMLDSDKETARRNIGAAEDSAKLDNWYGHSVTYTRMYYGGDPVNDTYLTIYSTHETEDARFWSDNSFGDKEINLSVYERPTDSNTWISSEFKINHTDGVAVNTDKTFKYNNSEILTVANINSKIKGLSNSTSNSKNMITLESEEYNGIELSETIEYSSYTAFAKLKVAFGAWEMYSTDNLWFYVTQNDKQTSSLFLQGSDSPYARILAKTQDGSAKTELYVKPTGIYYNDEEIATKADITKAITITLNTAV